MFSAAGFDHHGALHAARLFTGFLYGHIQDELQEQVHDPDETDDLLRLGLHRLPITQFPRLRSLATVLATYDGAAELDEGLPSSSPASAANSSPDSATPHTRPPLPDRTGRRGYRKSEQDRAGSPRACSVPLTPRSARRQRRRHPGGSPTG